MDRQIGANRAIGLIAGVGGRIELMPYRKVADGAKNPVFLQILP